MLHPRVLFGDFTLEAVADRLRMHPRTLNRRLRAERTTFRKLLNKARFDTARRYSPAPIWMSARFPRVGLRRNQIHPMPSITWPGSRRPNGAPDWRWARSRRRPRPTP